MPCKLKMSGEATVLALKDLTEPTWFLGSLFEATNVITTLLSHDRNTPHRLHPRLT